MSGFDGLRGIVSPDDSLHYTPGVDSTYYDLIHDLIEDFARCETMKDIRRYPKRFKRKHEKRLRTLENLDGYLFLDSLIAGLQTDGNGTTQFYSALLIGPVINSLYQEGFEGFYVDMRRMDTTSPSQVGGFLTGTKKNPITLRCDLHLDSRGIEVGGWSKYAVVRVNGPAKWVGQHSRNSDFTLENMLTGGLSLELGEGAKDCTFKLSGVVDASLVSSSMDSPYTCGYRYECVLEDSGLKTILYVDQHFFKRRNSVFIPEGETWREIRPDKHTPINSELWILSSSRYGAITK